MRTQLSVLLRHEKMKTYNDAFTFIWYSLSFPLTIMEACSVTISCIVCAILNKKEALKLLKMLYIEFFYIKNTEYQKN